MHLCHALQLPTTDRNLVLETVIDLFSDPQNVYASSEEILMTGAHY